MTTDVAIENILQLTKEIKAMVAATRREAALDPVHDKLNDLSRAQDAIRNDLREIIMLIAQSQQAAD